MPKDIGNHKHRQLRLTVSGSLVFHDPRAMMCGNPQPQLTNDCQLLTLWLTQG